MMFYRLTFELSGAALPRPVEREARNELERLVMQLLGLEAFSSTLVQF